MTDRLPQDSDGETWRADWETHRRDQLVIGLRATPAERLAWLESMIALAFETGALPRARSDTW